MRTLLSIVALSIVFALPGCHCCGWTEHYADKIDDIADCRDYRNGLDDCYVEKLDVTRWCMNGHCQNGHCQNRNCRRCR